MTDYPDETAIQPDDMSDMSSELDDSDKGEPPCEEYEHEGGIRHTVSPRTSQLHKTSFYSAINFGSFLLDNVNDNVSFRNKWVQSL